MQCCRSEEEVCCTLLFSIHSKGAIQLLHLLHRNLILLIKFLLQNHPLTPKPSCDAAACPSVTIQPEIQSIYDSQMTEACSGNIPDKPTPIAQQTGPAFTGGSEASPAAGSGGSAATETGAAAGASSTAGSGAEGALVGKGVVLGAVGVVGVVGLVV